MVAENAGDQGAASPEAKDNAQESIVAVELKAFSERLARLESGHQGLQGALTRLVSARAADAVPNLVDDAGRDSELASLRGTLLAYQRRDVATVIGAKPESLEGLSAQELNMLVRLFPLMRGTNGTAAPQGQAEPKAPSAGLEAASGRGTLAGGSESSDADLVAKFARGEVVTPEERRRLGGIHGMVMSRPART